MSSIKVVTEGLRPSVWYKIRIGSLLLTGRNPYAEFETVLSQSLNSITPFPQAMSKSAVESCPVLKKVGVNKPEHMLLITPSNFFCISLS